MNKELTITDAKTRALGLVLMLLCAAGCEKQKGSIEVIEPSPESPSTDKSVEDSSARWAVAIVGKAGLTNLHKINEQLYRGAQPTEEGFAQLKAMGVKTVVNLRTYHSDRRACAKAGLDYVKISVQAWEGEDEEVIDFLKVATDPARWPVFVHCQHGADRTGTMCAIYRITIEGWSKEDAIGEMTEGEFGFHSVWHNLITCIQELDIETIKQKVGV